MKISKVIRGSEDFDSGNNAQFIHTVTQKSIYRGHSIEGHSLNNPISFCIENDRKFFREFYIVLLSMLLFPFCFPINTIALF